MIMKPIRKLKWFWAWQDEKEEAWLGEMARQGLHLETIPFPGLYQFLPGDPGNYVYRLDFQSLKTKDRDSYLQLFADAGWEYVGDMGGWVYFRHIVTGNEIPEIYSDLESKMGKYQRVLAYLVIFLPIMVILVPESRDLDRYGFFSVIIEIMGVILILLYTLALVQLFRRIHSLRKTGTLS